MSKRFRVILLVLLVVGGIFNFSHTVHAEDAIQWPIDIDATNFPDGAFRTYLLEQSYVVDAVLSEAEMKNVTEIDVAYNEDIASLEGIEYFQNLEFLNCSVTGISRLDVSKNTKLKTLECSFANISNLDVSYNTNLKYLDCDSANISNLDVSHNTNLETLYCSSTNISNLDVSYNTNLQILTCGSTNISNLDVGHNTNLKSLVCDSTNISNLDVSHNTNLETLECSSTNISNLDLSHNTKLENLVCESTKISNLDASNTSLTYLSCVDCKTPVLLSSGNIIDLSQLTGLNPEKLSAPQNATQSGNQLSVQDPSEMVSYTYNCGKGISATFSLEISSYEINYDANSGTGEMAGETVNKGELFTLPQNSFTAPSGMQFKEWAIGSIDGEKVEAGGTHTFTGATAVYAVWEPIPIAIDANNFPDEAFRTYLKEQDFGKDGELSEAEMQTVIIINVASKNIVSLKGIEHFQKLVILQGNDNLQLTSLDVSHNALLATLDCSNTGIKELDISKNTRLQKLYCSNTQISGLDVGKNTKLQELNCSNTGISSLNVSKNTKLKNLWCEETNISELNVSKNVDLQKLSCDSTGIVELDVSDNTKLESLNCSFTGIGSLDISNNANLQTLYCSSTKISNLDASNTSLTDLSCVGCKTPVLLSSGNIIDLSQLTGLNPERLSDPQNATRSGNQLTVQDSSERVSYTYNCGKGISATFSLEISSYEINYDANSGTGEMTGETLNKGELFTLPQNSFTAPSGMQFKEWAIGSIDGEKVEAGGTYTFTGATTVYAVWEPIPKATYTIIYDANDGTGQMEAGTATEGIAFTLPQNSFTAPSGMQFKEWAIGSIDGGKVEAGGTYTFTGATTVYAVWEPIPTYTITYNAVNGLGQMEPGTATKGKLFTLPQPEFTAPEGTQFREWAIGSIFGEGVKAGETYTFTEATTVYAVWESISEYYSIIYDANSGAGQMESGSAQRGELFTLPQNEFTAPSGKRFKEWAIGSIEGTKVKAEGTYTFTEVTTVYAIWEKIPETYTITYNANGGTGQMEAATATEETLFTLPQNGFTAPSGKRFKEWAIGSAGGTKVKAGSTYTFTGVTTVYAVWEPIPVSVTTYTITFNANGGAGQMAGATVTKGKVFTLPQNSFTAPSGKRFKEWAIGSAGGAKVKAGSTYTFTGTTTVYAVWEPIPATVTDVKKATFKDLQLKAKASKTSNKLSWKRVKGADGYVVYGAKRGKKLTEIKAATKGVSFTHKKLSKKTFYQYQVKAYRLVNGEKKIISVSQNIYSVTTGGKYDNAKKLTVNASKLTLKKGKTKTIKAKLVGTKGKKLRNFTKAFRYETTNSKIATVSAKGKIKARKKGKCTIYVYAQNGLSKAIRVTVK